MEIYSKLPLYSILRGDLEQNFERGTNEIPEGIYGIEYLNPKSKFHLSMKLSYPKSALYQGSMAINSGALGHTQI